MTNHPNRSKAIPRPVQHLHAAGQMYPGAWKQSDDFRAGRGVDLPDWPDWCYLPLAASYAIVSADAGVDRLSPELISDVARLNALSTWRLGQGIYRFDPSLYSALINTPVSGDLPCDVLYHLPEWCIYIELIDYEWQGDRVHGVFIHLEWDANSGRHELRLLIDAENDLFPVPIHLGKHSLPDAIDEALNVSRTWAATMGMTLPDGTKTILHELLEPIMALLLYLCTEAADYGDGDPPANPRPKKTKRGWRMFPAEKPKQWDVGQRMGAALRRAYQQEQTGSGATHAGTRAHIRRAHWHSYWTGPRDGEQTIKIRWLPPIEVAMDDTDPDAMPAVVRPVK